jgi:hypothetical protein
VTAPLQSRAVAEIDGATHELGHGDFVAFPTPSVAQSLGDVLR